MLVDEVNIVVKAGDGGPGRVAFSKTKQTLGPTGGSGGRGGSVYAEGVSDISALNQFFYKKKVEAGKGEMGGDGKRDGRSGEDLTLKVPVGTKIINITTGEISEIMKIGEQKTLAEGGKGGRGNFLFRSSKNTSPKRAQRGLPGDVFTYRLELQLIADVGFVGFPNAGKSSLLNALTRANVKVANYKFTTLEPNLGVYYELILADIPGLIEGASSGKGLGFKFLRHIERAGILFHLVSAESDDVARDYQAVRRELGEYNPKLLEKREYALLSKYDLADSREAGAKLSILKKLNKNASLVSVQADGGLHAVKKVLAEIANEKTVAQRNPV